MNMKNKIYYTLVVKEDGVWVNEFGDYDRQAVKFEMNEANTQRRKKDMKILTSDGTQSAILSAVEQVNKEEGTDELVTERVKHYMNDQIANGGDEAEVVVGAINKFEIKYIRACRLFKICNQSMMANEEPEEVMCPDCEGRGRTNGVHCERCNSYGKIWENEL